MLQYMCLHTSTCVSSHSILNMSQLAGVLAIARTRFKPCHGAQTMFHTKAAFQTKAAVPTAADKCVLSSRTRTSLKIRWIAPDGCGSGITGYDVEWCRALLTAARESAERGGGGAGGVADCYKEDGEGEGSGAPLTSKETSWNLKKLGPGQHFGFRVRAFNLEVRVCVVGVAWCGCPHAATYVCSCS